MLLYSHSNGLPLQLSMFDAISNSKSLLVVAPTSSGKTLAGEYAMRFVCQQYSEPGDDSIAVFLQPTNALVNQTYSNFCVDPVVVGELDSAGERVGAGRLAMFTKERRVNFTGFFLSSVSF